MARAGVLYVPSHVNLGSHPKTLKVCRRLGISRVQAVGHLHFLWWWAMSYAPDGDLSEYDNEDLAIAAEWESDPDAFVTALEACGFITDRQLHNWDQYGGKLIQSREKAATRQAHRRDTKDMSPTRHGDVTGTSPLHIRDSKEEERREEEKREYLAADAETKPENISAFPAQKKRTTAKATQLPSDWQPTEDEVQYAKERGFSDSDITEIAEDFRLFYQSHGRAMPNWHLTFLRWVREAKKREDERQQRFAPRQLVQRPVYAVDTQAY